MIKKEYCSVAFLDVFQAFDCVWHEDLLFKVKKLLPINFYIFLKSYLSNRHFIGKQGEEVTDLHSIQPGILQESMLRPILYFYTSDLSMTKGAIIGTFADDTAALAVDESPVAVSTKLQTCLNNIS